MLNSTLEIAIAGCGIAGMASALFLSRLGHEVTVFDSFDEPEPVGSGLILQPTGQAVLQQLDLLTQLTEVGAPITKLIGYAHPSNKVVLDVRYEHLSGSKLGLSVHRNALFECLYQAVSNENVALELDCQIEAHETQGSQSILIDQFARRFGPFDLCIDALGARSPLQPGRSGSALELPFAALWTNIPASAQDLAENGLEFDALQQRYERASKMVGVLPIGRQSTINPTKEVALFWSLRTDDWQKFRDDGLAAWKSEVLKLWPELEFLLVSIRHVDQLIFAKYLHTGYAHPVRGSMVAVGDSAHATSPQLGQGANMALLDAYALFVALSLRDDLQDALQEYGRQRRINRWIYQWASRLLTPFYQSDHAIPPILRDGMLASMARIPPMPKILAKLVSGDLVPPTLGYRWPPAS